MNNRFFKVFFSFLLIFISFCNLFSQNIVSGKIQTTSYLYNTFNFRIDKHGKPIDSFTTDKLGFYKINLDTGRYTMVINNLGKVHSIPILVTQNSQTMNIHFNQENPNTLEFKDFKILNHIKKAHDAPASITRSKEKAITEESKTKLNVTKSETRLDALSLPVEFDEDLSKDARTTSAGQITAGHWKDLLNWDKWLNTNKNPLVKMHQETWGFQILNGKIELEIIDNKNQAFAFVKVDCFNEKGDTLWTSFSDVKGKVYLWPSVFNAQSGNFKLQLSYNEHFEKLDLNAQQLAQNTKIKFNQTASPIDLLEIGFVVDATGSMGDEIQFLKMELTDVIARIQKANRCLNIKTGAVFYKDKLDDYLTRCLPLDSDPSRTITFISNQNASGGGDRPEAVDDALQDAVLNLGWSNQKGIKLIFLLLDAPPHQDSMSKAKIKKYTQLAAAKGIQIIPIAASGIDESTEFLMKYLAISTNGEYIYITDDSKIGNSHLKPTGGSSDVILLNDLLVKTILDYSGNPCQKVPNELIITETDSLIDGNDNLELIIHDDWQLSIYPNPSTNFVKIACNSQVDVIKITNLNGQIVFQKEQSIEAITSINTSTWANGIYIISVKKGLKESSCKLIVMH